MKTLRTALVLFALMCAVLGIMYPLMITGIAQVVFPFQANGSLIVRKGGVIGSELIGQTFLSQRYFRGRPSACDYDGGSSSGSNLGPTSVKWQELVTVRILEDAHFNILLSPRPVPSDLVTASASGLDPHISIEAAMAQIPRIAQARSLDETLIRSLVMKNAEKPFFGPHCVNVLKLNLALDDYETTNKRKQP
jgi:K+-transporting ATPase ATPase C chain